MRVAERDGCVVPTEPLAGLLGGFVTDWRRGREETRGRFARSTDALRTEVPAIRAIEWLAVETGIPEETINSVLRARRKTTELRIADALMMAIGRPDVFVDGDPPTLPIMANRLASSRARAECCGGSLLGTIF